MLKKPITFGLREAVILGILAIIIAFVVATRNS